jgi:hypothetical protein
MRFMRLRTIRLPPVLLGHDLREELYRVFAFCSEHIGNFSSDDFQHRPARLTRRGGRLVRGW